MDYDTYTSPLASRNASAEMLRIWSPRHKFQTWRRIWLAVAEAQQACGLEITDEQVAELRAVVERGITDEEIDRAGELERELRHDVMAHVHCLGEQCPKAKPIIHLGCTSQDVVCNADLLIQFEAIERIFSKVEFCVHALGTVAGQYKSLPTLGFTHYQPAQPTTVGRRMAGWAFDLMQTRHLLLFEELGEHPVLRGFRGATGTQASFVSLFSGDQATVDRFEALAIWNLLRSVGLEEGDLDRFLDTTRAFAEPIESLASDLIKQVERDAGFGDLADDEPDEPSFEWNEQGYIRLRTFQLTGQTYPRVHDAQLLATLGATASVLHKTATDIRLLSNRKEIDEPFGDRQIGSSAMPYKRNPMRCERICGLTRFVMNLVGNAYDTAATQWLERTLDDSSNRRLSLPEAFLALDGALDLMHNVASGLVVHEAMVRRNLMAELPFLATENILMAAVKAGGDRQDLHERIRVHSQAAGARVKDEGLDNDLLERLQADPAFQGPGQGGALSRDLDWDDLMDPMKYVGRAAEQVDRFVQEVVEPLREQHGEVLERLGGSEPRV